nr:MAG TPA: hypothetical protein [Caudoviricetes sp.]
MLNSCTNKRRLFKLTFKCKCCCITIFRSNCQRIISTLNFSNSYISKFGIICS